MPIEPIQVGLLASIKHFPTDGKTYTVTHHFADQIEFILVTPPVAMYFADVNHIGNRYSAPELRVSWEGH
jgi:hypothetical protein